MLRLVRGKSGKSVLMNLLYRGTENSKFISISTGNDTHVSSIEGDCYNIHISLLEELLKQIVNKLIIDKVSSVFIYGNFDVDTVEIFKDIHMLADGRLNLTVSIQDKYIQQNYLLLEEIY